MFIQYSTTLFWTRFSCVFVQISNFTAFFLAHQKLQNFVLSPSQWRLQGTRTKIKWYEHFDTAMVTLFSNMCINIYITLYNYNYWLIHYLQSFESDTIGVKLHSEEWNFLPLKAPWSPAACNASKATNGTSVLFWCKIGGGVDGTNLIEDMKADIWVHEFFTPPKKNWHFFCENATIFVKIQVWIIEVVDWPLANEVWGSWGVRLAPVKRCQPWTTLICLTNRLTFTSKHH